MTNTVDYDQGAYAQLLEEMVDKVTVVLLTTMAEVKDNM